MSKVRTAGWNHKRSFKEVIRHVLYRTGMFSILARSRRMLLAGEGERRIDLDLLAVLGRRLARALHHRLHGAHLAGLLLAIERLRAQGRRQTPCRVAAQRRNFRDAPPAPMTCAP